MLQVRCCWYHKGTNFQANHNLRAQPLMLQVRCCWYHKGTNFQANHNTIILYYLLLLVVADTTKVRIFKQITTSSSALDIVSRLLLIPQRYEFSSKSQQENNFKDKTYRCCWYHKGTNFQANHNTVAYGQFSRWVVADTTKVRIFKQITTSSAAIPNSVMLLLIPQRYEFSSKSQPPTFGDIKCVSCCWYHKGTNFQANHNIRRLLITEWEVVADTTKVRIFKQITTWIAITH